MDKLLLESYLKDNLSFYKIAEREGVSFTTVKYWINKYGINPNKKNRTCVICDTEFLANGRKKFCSQKCRAKDGNRKHQNYSCQQNRGLSRKLKLIKPKQYKCEICGYDKNLAALQFHHKDPETKSDVLGIRNLSTTSWEWCLLEAEKCSLLCANCHLELHNPTLFFDSERVKLLFEVEQNQL